MPVKGLTPEEIAAATAAVVAAGGKSTDRANRLPGETATEANARINAGYKAQPVPELSQAGKDAGAIIKFVRTGAGGVGEYKEVFPIGGSATKQSTTTTTTITNTGPGVESDYTINPNNSEQVLYKGTPFSGVRNDVLFVNGYRQDLYTPDGKPRTPGTQAGLKTDAQIAADTAKARAQGERQSAYDLLYEEFNKYGLASLVEPLKGLIISGASPSEFTIRLRETEAYKKRFAANEARVKNGLRALSEAEYIRNEDAYQEVMRRRGLPPEYYAKGDLGVQKGFESLLAGDVSSTELEDRIVTAQDRVINANPEIAATLKQFYPGISNGDILAYTLDPANAINAIKRKITAAEIGAAAGTYGLGTTVGRAEQLAGAGVTEATAQQGFKTISQVGPRAGVLAEFYKQDPYTQDIAEREFFGLTGAREAEMQRKKLTSLETAEFSGSAGAGAIARDRAGVL
jgi:hypothetical protein